MAESEPETAAARKEEIARTVEQIAEDYTRRLPEGSYRTRCVDHAAEVVDALRAEALRLRDGTVAVPKSEEG